MQELERDGQMWRAEQNCFDCSQGENMTATVQEGNETEREERWELWGGVTSGRRSVCFFFSSWWKQDKTENRAEHLKDAASQRWGRSGWRREIRNMEWVLWASCAKRRCKSRAGGSRRKGRLAELKKRDAVLRLEGNEGESCGEIEGEAGNYWRL